MNVALMGSDKRIQVFALIGLFATALAGSTSSEASDPPAIDQTIPGATKWGYYSGEPVTRWSPDGRNMILVTELRYTDPKGEVWVAAAGSVTDGASIPRYLWSLMGGPFEGQYRNASVLHDAAYEKKNRPWQDCDRMFYYAMRCSGVNAVEAKTMFYVVYKFAPHWKFPNLSVKRQLRRTPGSRNIRHSRNIPSIVWRLLRVWRLSPEPREDGVSRSLQSRYAF